MLTKDVKNISKLIDDGIHFERVIGFGGGTVTDIAKFVASKYNKPLTYIPTMLYTNSYATDKVALISDNKKITINENRGAKQFYKNCFTIGIRGRYSW